MSNKIQDINLFAIGDVVSITSAQDFQNIRIERISDSGVTISGPKCSPNTVISGKSPAYLVKRGEVSFDMPEGIKPMVSESSEEPSFNKDGSERAKRGAYIEKMKNLTVPEIGKSFTIKQFAELNNIPIGHALAWVKQNCREVGKADKQEGQRGRAASLYQINFA